MCVCPVNAVYLQCAASGRGSVVGEARSGAVCVYVWDFLLLAECELVCAGKLQKDPSDHGN